MREWQKKIRKVTPYVPGEQPRREGVIKLNTNENPYPPSPLVQQAHQAFSTDCLRLYPDPEASELTAALALYHGCDPRQVFVGVGSDDVLAMAFQTFFNSDQPIRFPDITYSFYDVWAELFRIPYRKMPLDDSFRLVLEDYCETSGGIVFPNPNAPTAICEPVSFVEKIVRANSDCVVIVDEAYIDFGGESCLPLTKQYDNLLVVRTFSKSRALAGLRIGYCVGSEALIQALCDVKQSFNSYTMSQEAIALGVASIADETYFREQVKKITDTRKWVCTELEELGFSFPPSSANFIFAAHRSVEAREIFEAARQRNIYVRYFDKPRISNYLRITIGTEEQMRALIEFLREFLASK